MASRYFFALCALALIAAVVAAPVEEVDANELDEERFLPAIVAWAAGEGASWLYGHFVHVKAECFPDVIKSCKHNPLFHPNKYYKCADNYFKAHPERCMKEH